MEVNLSCVDCGVKACSKQKSSGDKAYPPFCPTPSMNPELLDSAMSEYEKEEVQKVTQAAADVVYENYGQFTRVQEVMAFAEKLGAKKLGIATCVGLLKESRILAKILRAHGFEVVSISCKAGDQEKYTVGIPECYKNLGVNMCNPVLQAKYLNEQKTDLNLVVGLCVGHDSLFYKYSEALVTTVVTKDRVLGHNPVQALYQAESYYYEKLFE
ncbi:MAG: DUF1847 domain-containing protein [Dorea sp.]|nr:DUF1847 domain-containing protein [Dorea sp.]